MNPNSSLASTLSITLAGIMLGLGYVLSGDLAIPTGIHISWNFAQGGLFGFSVSGLDFGTSSWRRQNKARMSLPVERSALKQDSSVLARLSSEWPVLRGTSAPGTANFDSTPA